jgi:hypothetical protein
LQGEGEGRDPEMSIGRMILVSVALAAAAKRALAQNELTPCDLTSKGPASSETVNGQNVSSGSGGITVVCRSRHITLVADSGHMIANVRVDLFGHVHYTEPSRIELRSDVLTYYQLDERIVVTGNVTATLPSGSTLVGPEAMYLRQVTGRRSIDSLTAIRSPTVTIAAQGDTGKPVIVNATTIFMRGDSIISASRKVVITRPDLIARGDSAYLDGRANQETIRLMFTPSVEGLQGKKFRLEGTIIDAYSKDKKLQRVVARGKGLATSQDLEITSDTIDLRMSNDAMERAIAWSHPGQARATTTSESILADSIDVVMPKQKIRIVHAVRRAYAQADADTVRFRTTEKDWLRGDTVTAWFDTTATKDTSTTPPLKQILAVHRGDSAQAYYHMAPSDTAVHTPAISYVRGGQIRLDFDNRKVAMVAVRDSVFGMYLEPHRDSVAAPAATAGKGSRKTPTRPAPKRPPAATPVRKPPDTTS